MRTVLQTAISISVVSHGQAILVTDLLADMEQHCRNEHIEVILTLNLPEELPFLPDEFSFPIKVLKNSAPMGFAANHNQAFTAAEGEFFCVLNPDVRLPQDPLKQLVEVLQDHGIGLVAPLVVNSNGTYEDSVRHFPRPMEIVGKVFGRASAKHEMGTEALAFPDWVAGMFMLFRSAVFRELGGFDGRYFLYYEDVDLCARLSLCGYRVAVCREVTVIHDARRDSHKNLRHLKWHASSLTRFFLSPVYRQLQHRD